MHVEASVGFWNPYVSMLCKLEYLIFTFYAIIVQAMTALTVSFFDAKLVKIVGNLYRHVSI
jgi:hypothetical protein